MTERIIIAGAGGQGIMLLGKVMAEAAMRENKYVTCLPCYGAEVRGGTSYCMVVISDAEISSPHIDKADTLIIMNNPSLERFKTRINSKGLLLINGSLIDKYSTPIKPALKTKMHIYPFTDIALKLGNIRIANIIALGCYLAYKKSIDLKTIIKAIEEIAPEDKRGLIEINKQALFSGYKLKK